MKGMASEFKVLRLRDFPASSAPVQTPELAVEFWRQNVPASSWYDAEKECFVVLLLNTRRVITGFNLVSLGSLDQVIVHARETYRAAIVGGAAAIIVAHNHPSGDPTPSEADIRVTRDLVGAGKLIKIDLLDHLIIGQPSEQNSKGWCSLKELGYIYA